MTPSVVIYTTPTCVYCKGAKEFFKEHNIAYTEYDVAADRMKIQEMIHKSGQLGVPVITVTDENGKEEVVIGFDKPRLAELLGVKS